MNVLINGQNASSLPAMFLFAISPSGSEAGYHLKTPPLLKDKENMLDAMQVCVARLQREIGRDFEAKG